MRFTTVTWPIYCQGYYAALSAAVKVLALAVRRRRIRQKLRRQAAQQRRRQLEAGLIAPATPESSPQPAPSFRVRRRVLENPKFYRPTHPLRLASRQG